MKVKMKKYGLWIVILVASISMIVGITLAGCEKEAVTEEKVAEEEAVEEEAVEEEVAEEEAVEEEEVGLVFWHVKTDEQGRDIVQGTVDSFMEKYSNIKFDVLPIDTTVYKEKLQLALGGMNPPDIFFWFGGMAAKEMIDDGFVLDIDKEMREIEDNLMASSLGGYTIEGKIMGAPHTDVTHMMVYNKEIFNKYSLDIPNTWEEFTNVCETLKKNGEVPIAWDAKDIWMGDHFMDKVLASYAGQDGKTAIYNEMDGMKNDSVAKSFSTMKELATKGYLDPQALAYNWSEAQSVFFNMDAAMYWGSSWEAATYKEELGEPGNFKVFEYGFFSLPGPGPNNVRYGGGTSLMGFSGTEHPEEVKQFLLYWVSHENAMYFIEKGFEGMSSNREALEDSKEKLNYWQVAHSEQGSNPDYSNYYAGSISNAVISSIRDAYSTIVQQVMWSDMTVEEAVELCVELFNTALVELEEG